MKPAKITIESGDGSLEVVRVNVTVKPAQQVGPTVTMPPHMRMDFVVNQVQAIVVREKPNG